MTAPLMKRYIIKKKITLTFEIVTDSEKEAMAIASEDSNASEYFLHDYFLKEVDE